MINLYDLPLVLLTPDEIYERLRFAALNHN